MESEKKEKGPEWGRERGEEGEREWGRGKGKVKRINVKPSRHKMPRNKYMERNTIILIRKHERIWENAVKIATHIKLWGREE